MIHSLIWSCSDVQGDARWPPNRRSTLPKSIRYDVGQSGSSLMGVLLVGENPNERVQGYRKRSSEHLGAISCHMEGNLGEV